MNLFEKDMEDLILKNPKKYLNEDGLKLISRQYSIGNYRFDLLFEDRHGAQLIVEIQRGTLDRNHTYKIFDYYDAFKEKFPSEFVELLVIANKIPRERRDRLTSMGICFKEIPESIFFEELLSRNKNVADKASNHIHFNKDKQSTIEFKTNSTLIEKIKQAQPKANYLKHIDSEEKIDFIEKLDSLVLQLDPEIKRRFLKKGIMYSKDNINFGQIDPQKRKIVIGPLLVKWKDLNDPKKISRDIRTKKYAAGGEVRSDFMEPYTDIDHALFLIKQSLVKS